MTLIADSPTDTNDEEVEKRSKNILRDYKADFKELCNAFNPARVKTALLQVLRDRHAEWANRGLEAEGKLMDAEDRAQIRANEQMTQYLQSLDDGEGES